MDFIGRSEELLTLNELTNSNNPEFLAVYGRRRVGKTYLIRTYFSKLKSVIFFNATGTKNAPLQEQIEHFSERIGDAFFSGVTPKTGKTWDETFKKLTSAINSIPKNKKIILFLDELPWMATPNSCLLQSLDYYWNQYWSLDKRIKLIACGSSASWIIKKIINNKGGLHNRITRKMRLSPFALCDAKKFLNSRGVKLNDNQIAKIYMVTGGIPYYLTGIGKGLSAAQAIEKLAFKKNSLLLTEFDNLFSSLFSNAEAYIDLVRIISKNHYGMAQTDILEKTSYLTKGGGAIEKLKELKDAGFIAAFKPFEHNKRGIYYRVVDEYTLFYFQWIEPIKETLQEESMNHGYWQGLQSTPAWHSWSGYAFESICYKHINQIRRKLNIPVTAIAHTWRYAPLKNTEASGAQIDLLFDRKDDSITICEIKYSEQPFVITKQYAKNILNKQKVFVEKTRTKKHIFINLISANGLAENLYADDLISGVATLDDLFQPAS